MCVPRMPFPLTTRAMTQEGPPTYAILTILFIFLISLIGALLPLHLTPYPRLTRHGNALAAGFLVAAAFVHLLPDAHVPLAEAVPLYPIDGLLALLGASAVFVFDHVARRHTRRKVTGPSTALAYILAATLSFHSLVEGLTLGFSMLHAPRFTAVAAAILAHKFFAALALGSSLASASRMEGTREAFRNAVCTAIIFACVTPSGALLGALAIECLTTGIGKTITAALSCLSAGVFLYVAFVELLAEEFREEEQDVLGYEPISREEDDTPQRAATFLVAASAMSLLAIWT